MQGAKTQLPNPRTPGLPPGPASLQLCGHKHRSLPALGSSLVKGDKESVPASWVEIRKALLQSAWPVTSIV